MCGVSAREPNIYAPPQDQPPARPGEALDEARTITCTVVLESDDMRAGLAINAKLVRWLAPVWTALIGFVSGLSAPASWQIGQTIGFGAFGWMVAWAAVWVSARRSLANKTESERTLTYGFSAAGVEITSALTYSRVKWPAVHRFGEGSKVFALNLSEAVVQVIPKRALQAADVDALRAMFKTYITPRKRRSGGAGTVIVALWVVLLAFLAVWQFLNSDVMPPQR
jgi:hypothetical protein